MKTLKNWTLLEKTEHGVTLVLDTNADKKPHHFCVSVLENNLIRILIKKNETLELDRTWSIAPVLNNQTIDVPFEGRKRTSLEGFSCPAFIFEQINGQISLATTHLKVVIHQPLYLEWFYRKNPLDAWQFLANDRKTGAYCVGVTDTQSAHFMQRELNDQYYGLGEKAGDLNREGKRYEMRNLDAMGYNAATTDPLYKHWPFTITRRNNISFGIFYDNLATCMIDLGNELDNYHLPYRKYTAEAGDLNYYFFVGTREPSVLETTKAFVRLTGKTIFSPKWSLGYSGSTMSYTDAPDAQVQLQQFIKLCQEHHIACDSFQLSSGYTSIGTKRYVFHWNTQKVPDILSLSSSFHHAGIKLAANIKPCLLHDHPKYKEVSEAGLFISDSEYDKPEISIFWDDDGSHLDFTNPKTITWWQDNVTTQLLEKGIDATWNDNNEYEIWDKNARCHGFGKPIAIKLIRPLMPLLMMRASFEAQQRFAPNLRPYLISRSGCAGMQRYVQTWSGDNRTNWQTLRYNTRMGVGMSISGLYNVGHDVGGFAGNKPDPELFVRWVQNGVMHPRFTIHSWNDDKSVNEPWMYPAITPLIRAALQIRYQLLPYFYNILWQAHIDDEPMLRPTFLDHEHDPKTFAENDDFLIGKDILVASVVEQGSRKRCVYLPDNTQGWYCYYTHQWFAGGQSITLDAPLERLPLLVRAGSILPLSKRIGFVDQNQDDVRIFQVFPMQDNSISTGKHFEDDGISNAWKTGGSLQLTWTMHADHTHIYIDIQKTGDYQPAFAQINFILAKNESRILMINSECTDTFS
ncbi:glucosidase [Gammaproteobacteria bacterium]|nr:glucosidase [Gammaproteobacteria bacterium]